MTKKTKNKKLFNFFFNFKKKIFNKLTSFSNKGIPLNLLKKIKNNLIKQFVFNFFYYLNFNVNIFYLALNLNLLKKININKHFIILFNNLNDKKNWFNFLNSLDKKVLKILLNFKVKNNFNFFLKIVKFNFKIKNNFSFIKTKVDLITKKYNLSFFYYCKFLINFLFLNCQEIKNLNEKLVFLLTEPILEREFNNFAFYKFESDNYKDNNLKIYKNLNFYLNYKNLNGKSPINNEFELINNEFEILDYNVFFDDQFDDEYLFFLDLSSDEASFYEEKNLSEIEFIENKSNTVFFIFDDQINLVNDTAKKPVNAYPFFFKNNITRLNLMKKFSFINLFLNFFLNYFFVTFLIFKKIF